MYYRRKWRRKWQPTPVFLPGKSRGWRNLVGYSPWGRKESDTTERHLLYYNVLYRSNTISYFFLKNHKMGNSNEEAGATTLHESVFSLQHNSAAFPFHSL